MISPPRFSAVRRVQGTPSQVQAAMRGLEELGRKQGVTVKSRDTLLSTWLSNFQEITIYTKEHADSLERLAPSVREYERRLRKHEEKFNDKPLIRLMKSKLWNGRAGGALLKLVGPFLFRAYQRQLQEKIFALPKPPEDLARFDVQVNETLAKEEKPFLQASNVLNDLEQGIIDLTQDRFNAPDA